MIKKVVAMVLVAVLLTGCGWMDGSYVYIVPHVEQPTKVQAGTIRAENYAELLDILVHMISQGTENSVIDVSGYIRGNVREAMETACAYVMQSDPIAAYAVEEITFDIGNNAGKSAIAVNILYRRSRTEIQQIRKKQDMEGVKISIHSALGEHAPRMVVLVDRYEEMDFDQIVRDYAAQNPYLVMEIPQISEGVYGLGKARIVELNFTYQNTRENLKLMQTQVKPIFEAAILYVMGEGAHRQKFSQLSGFLMERFDYTIETSITPSYSLLCHGVGDSRAFAEVYASMCRRAGLDCQVVTGTRNGEPWTWNIVCDNDQYYHVDLLRSSREGGFRVYTDGEMQGYVWDYSAYPACEVPYQEHNTQPQQTTPTEEQGG